MSNIQLTTTIEQTTGYHADGTPYVQLVTRTTDAVGLGWSGEGDEDWWTSLVSAMHAADIAILRLTPEQRKIATRIMDDANVSTLDLEDQPAAMLAAAESARADSVRCECGKVRGVACTGPREVTIEWMPEDLRASHVAAGNRGSYPRNGAVRLQVSEECAQQLLAVDGEWTTRI